MRVMRFPRNWCRTQWMAEHLTDPAIRIVESNEDILLYSRGHIPGAVHIDWVADLNDPIARDYLNKARFEQLMSKHGIGNETLVVFYGDKSNWWACYALWIFELFGHTRSAVMDGGRLNGAREPHNDKGSVGLRAYRLSRVRTRQQADPRIPR